MLQPNYSYVYKLTDIPPKGDVSGLLKGDMKSLFLLSLMLTADVDSAESCFVSSLDDCMNMKPTVGEWTNGWTRHVLVHNAIAMRRPAIEDDEQLMSCNLALNPALHAVMRLMNFERFVFVLSILEGYSDRACSVLLGPSSRDIMAAKVRALENLAANLKCLPQFLGTGRGNRQMLLAYQMSQFT
ncbi:MAG: hypothetical protein WCC92_21180 [Candidatus Korobacteraceae bacterium]